MFNVLKEVLGELVRSIRTPRVFEAEMHCLIQTKPSADTTMKWVLSNARFIVLITKAIGKLVYGAVNEPCQMNMGEASTAVACKEPLVVRSPSCITMKSKISPDSESHENCSVVFITHLVPVNDRKRFRKDVPRYLTQSLTIFSRVGSAGIGIGSKHTAQEVAIHQNSL